MSIGTFMDEDGYGSWANTVAPKIKPEPTNVVGGKVTFAPSGVDEEGYGAAAGVFGAAPKTSTPPPPGPVNTATQPSNRYVIDIRTDANGNIIFFWSDGTTSQSGVNDGSAKRAEAERQSAFDIIKEQFDAYGMGGLAEEIRGLIQSNVSPSEFALRLRQTKAYQDRFSANATRIANGFRALDEATYLALEDQYANIMRKYGVPAWYTEQTGKYGKQGNLDFLIANDVSPVELEDRVQLAVNRIQNGPKEALEALKKFYPGITNGDVLAYMLDPKKALPVLQRQVQAAEIGGEALRYGLTAELKTADELAGLGVDQRQARAGYQAIGEGLQRGSQLAALYQEPDYNQKVAEAEVFSMNGAADASKKRKRIIAREQATFGGSSGIRGGALESNRSGSF